MQSFRATRLPNYRSHDYDHVTTSLLIDCAWYPNTRMSWMPRNAQTKRAKRLLWITWSRSCYNYKHYFCAWNAWRGPPTWICHAVVFPQCLAPIGPQKPFILLCSCFYFFFFLQWLFCTRQDLLSCGNRNEQLAIKCYNRKLVAKIIKTLSPTVGKFYTIQLGLLFVFAYSTMVQSSS